MPTMTVPNSAGRPQPDAGSGKPPAPFGGGGGMGAKPQGGGQIKISPAEEAALIAMETGDTEEEGIERAVEDSGLTEEQCRALKARAEAARKKGYALVGQRVQLKPLADGEEPNSLVGKAKMPETVDPPEIDLDDEDEE